MLFRSNLTNNEPVEIEAFLFSIFRRLGIEVPNKRLSTAKALKIATAIEWFYKWFFPRHEPPITRFGIGVLAFSKTFDVTKTLETFGPPSVALDDGVEAFIKWQKANMPTKS